MEKEKAGNLKPSVTARRLMDYLEDQLEESRFRPRDLDKIFDGLWAEKISCIVRDSLMFDGIQGARIIHYEVADAFYQILVVMKENDLTLENLSFEINSPEFPCPEILISIHTKEHHYKFYPVMLMSTYDSEGDEYLLIKNGVARLKAIDCDLARQFEEDL